MTWVEGGFDVAAGRVKETAYSRYSV